MNCDQKCDEQREQAAMDKDMQKYVECGCCGHWHPVEFYGDCRDDSNRFTTSDLEDHYGYSGFWDKRAIELEERELR